MTTPSSSSSAPAPSKAAAVAARFSFGGGAPKCATCTKSVYANERCDYDGATFHVECFKCLKCKSRLTPRDVAKIAGDIYCKPCFKKVFAEKGRYDSFGDKTVAKWSTTDAARKSSTGGAPSSTPSTTATPSVAPISEEAKVTAPTPAPAVAAAVVESSPAVEADTPAATAATEEAPASSAPVESEATPVGGEAVTDSVAVAAE